MAVVLIAHSVVVVVVVGPIMVLGRAVISSVLVWWWWWHCQCGGGSVGTVVFVKNANHDLMMETVMVTKWIVIP